MDLNCQATTLVTRFMRSTWGPPGADRTQVGPMLAPWTLLSGIVWNGPPVIFITPLKWRHNEHDGVSNHQPHDYLLNRSGADQRSTLRATGLCEGNSLMTGEFPAQRASNTENVSIWWRHHDNEQCDPVQQSPLLKHWNRCHLADRYSQWPLKICFSKWIDWGLLVPLYIWGPFH